MQMMLYMNLMEKNSAVKGVFIYGFIQNCTVEQVSRHSILSRFLHSSSGNDFSSLPVGLLLNMLGLDLEVEEVEDATLTVLVVADLEMIDGM